MRKNKWIILTCVMLGAAVVAAIGQKSNWWNDGPNDLPDAKAELKRLYALGMQADTSLYISGTIQLYDEKKIDELKESTRFISFRSGENFYMQLGPLQTFCNDSILVQMDTMMRQISLSRIDRKLLHESLYRPGVIFPFERFLSDTSAFRINVALTEKHGQRILSIQSDLNPEIASCNISYDPQNGRISNTELRWRKEENIFSEEKDPDCWLTKIRYEYKSGSKINIKELIDRILMVKEGQIAINPAYADYQIINNID